ncbi:MAG: geranylgeranylglycerol-phosphate geranylgeranyltransferase [Saprospiraceae bacterium]|nr:geranylgeranylglycerol-phosphate geranylgeranyltransferase [Saprospiraceae bacterium]
MNRLLAFPRLLRLPNLLIVLLTQWVPYWYVLRPAILRAGGLPVLTEYSFRLLAATTVVATLAGYIINDYFDRHIDAINKPHRRVVGRFLPPWIALVLYALALAGMVWLMLLLDAALPEPHLPWVFILFPVVSVLLFFYAWQLKCTPVLGNLLVALLCAAVPVIPLFPENRPLWIVSFEHGETVHQAVGLVWLYAMFAFVTTLLREQVKDLEDFPGDSACGCNTLAVIKGVRYARLPAGFTSVTVVILTCILMFFWVQTDAPDWQLIAGILCLLLPAAAVTGLIYGAKTRKHFSRASLLIKFIMLAGVFLLLRSWPPDVQEALSVWLKQQGY